MHNIQKAFEECKFECIACGIEIGYIEDISINSRAKSRWGMCRYDKSEDAYSIEISDRLVQDSVPIKSLKETLLHEMCHTIDGGWNHTGEWKKAVTKLNNRFGYNIKRVSTSEEKCVEENCFENKRSSKSKSTSVRRRNSEVKYVFQCKKCGAKIERTRKSKFTENPERYCCAGCGGMFKRVF